MMNVREYTPKDYEMLAAWWQAHEWPAVPAVILPKLGIVVEHDGAAICAGFLYMDNSVGVSMLEWVVANPEASSKRVFAGITMLVDFMSKRAVEMDYGVMLTSCRNQALAKLYRRTGFEVTDDSVVHLVKILRKREG
jgi:hypothetical protein